MSFLEIFQPGLRYLREERERQKLMVPRPPVAGRAPLGIDLDAGTAVIPMPASAVGQPARPEAAPQPEPPRNPGAAGP